ncbi:MAG: Gfo/Idh/MocA family oxidoreductase, partial [Lentisphaeraceae bacterium]|nr:Gfo/Idh/MocA family oxidoreductase [Lentisphaeraceae bacterium]
MPFNRRNFIKSATAVAAFQVVPSRVLGLNGQTPPSEELIRGIIGCGGMGSNHIAYRGSRILALCDVDSNRLSGGVRRAAGQGHKDVTAYHDFRDMIARPDIDIISIATPPHWHGLQAILAAEAGKDVWCEKPMTRTIGEGQRLVDACKRNGSILRINTWFRMIDNFYGMGIPVSTVKTAINSGLLGGPLTVTVGGGQGFGWKHNWSGKTDLKAETIPDYLDYDRWLGPAPWKEYARHRTHGSFRGYWDYDGGGLGDMGMHYLDPVQYLIGKDNTSPVKIEVDTDDQHHDAVGVWRRVILTYADGCR